MDCVALSVDKDNEIIILYNFIRDKYHFKFPALEALVHHPLHYARIVERTGNQTDLNFVDFQDLLPLNSKL